MCPRQCSVIFSSGLVEWGTKQEMHKYLKTILFIAGAFTGIVALLGIQKLESFDTIAGLLNDQAASAVLRNYGLLAIGLVGIVSAVIRLSMADTQQRLDKRSGLFDRFQKSSEMLDSSNMAVRQAGLYTLAEIAKEQPTEFYIIVQSLFCGFLRQASSRHKVSCEAQIEEAKKSPNKQLDWPTIPPDMQDALELITQVRNDAQNSLKIEARADHIMNLRGVFMPGGTFINITLKDTDISESTFDDSSFMGCIFDGSVLINTNVNRCAFDGCDLSNLHLSGTQMRMTCFWDGKISIVEAINVNFTGTRVENTDFPADIFGEDTCPLPGTSIHQRFPHVNAGDEAFDGDVITRKQPNS